MCKSVNILVFRSYQCCPGALNTNAFCTTSCIGKSPLRPTVISCVFIRQKIVSSYPPQANYISTGKYIILSCFITHPDILTFWQTFPRNHVIYMMNYITIVFYHKSLIFCAVTRFFVILLLLPTKFPTHSMVAKRGRTNQANVHTPM